MHKSAKVYVCLACALAALIFACPSYAKKKNADVITFDPVTDGGRYLTVQDSATMPQWSFNVGTFMDYAYEPLEFATQGERRSPVVDDLLTANFMGAVALTDWMQVGVNMPIFLWQTYYDPYVDFDARTKQVNKGKLGDLRLEMKFRLLNIDRYHFGVSLIPFMYFPTGASQYFLGNGMWSPGIILALEGDIKKRVYLALNAGYRMYNKTPYYYNELNPHAVVDDTFLLSAGAHVPLSKSWSVLGEFTSESVMSSLWSNEPQTPLNFMIAMRYVAQKEPRGLTFNVGAGAGITKGVGCPDYRILLGVNYRHIKGDKPPVEEVTCCYVEEKIVITQAIHFEFDKWNIRPVSYPVLDDVVTILMQNPQITLLRVEGHTDWIGSDAYNQKLSERRANSVRDYLISKGIAPGRLVAVGYGESRPIADNNTVQGRARNRRTEFTVISTGAPSAYVPPQPQPQPQPQPAPKPAAAPAAETPAAYGKYWTTQPQPAAAPAAPKAPAAKEPATYGKYWTTQPQPEAKPEAKPQAKAAPQAQPAPEPKPLPADVRTYTQNKGSIYFPPGSDALTEEAKKKINEVAAYVKKEKSVVGLNFQAFPAAEDSEMGNSQLSWNRANNAQSYFMTQMQGTSRKLDVSSFGFANTTFGTGEEANKGKVIIWVLRKFTK